MKFRQHRGSLADAMETVVEVEGFDGLLAHAQKLAAPWPTHPPVTKETLHIAPYGYDDRIGWDTHIVTLDGYGVLGFTDGPAEGKTGGLDRPKVGKCGMCRYYEEATLAAGDKFMACHRYPPTDKGSWPFVTPNDWCGEYFDKRAADSASAGTST